MSGYRTIVADPPWPIKDSGARTHAPGQGHRWSAKSVGKKSIVPYPTMSIDAIAGLPVRDLAESDAHLYMWAINQYLPEAYDVVRAWGFRPSTILTWCKAPMGLGLGGTFVNTTEFVIFARRGSLPALRRHPTTWFEMKRPYIGNGGPTHSAKPEAFLDLVEQISPGPYVELFARRNRLGWDTWGNEALEHVEVAPC